MKRCLNIARQVAVAAAMFMVAGWAQEDIPFAETSGGTILDFAERVVEQTPRYESARADFQRIEQSVKSARAAGLPEISIAASAAAANGDFDAGENGTALLDQFVGDGAGAGVADFGSNNTKRVGLSVTQPLFTGLKIRNGVVQAKSLTAAARANLEATRQRLLVDIADAYLSVATADGRLETAGASVTLLSRQVRAAEASFNVGQGTKTDIALARAQLASAEARLAASVAATVAARGEYLALTGAEEFTDIGEIVPLPVPENVGEAVERALARHPSLVAVRNVVEANEAAVRVARGARSPQIQLRGEVGYAEDQLIPGDSANNASLTAEISVPVFRGGAISADVSRARAAARSSRFDETEAMRQVEAGVRTAFAAFEAAELSLTAAKSRLDAIELAYEGVTLEREVGQRTILDVLRVEQDLQDARAGLLDAKREAVLASFRVHQSIGTLGQ